MNVCINYHLRFIVSASAVSAQEKILPAEAGPFVILLRELDYITVISMREKEQMRSGLEKPGEDS